MEYNFRSIEPKWQEYWNRNGLYKTPGLSSKPKYYVLDMFPYPSGAGLHVGHPLGYIASDIYARFKRLKGFNVLHPMGYDAFGLPAEQYAIEHGVHPAVSTKSNIENFRNQLDKIGFSYDWSREVNTSEPSYYKWTQWIFLQLFKSWYNRVAGKTEPIDTLIHLFETEGNKNHPFPGDISQLENVPAVFSPDEWRSFDEFTRESVLMQYRVAYCGYGEVNWCEALGTVLANDEVINGLSERGGYPVVRKKLRQWYLRITEYAERLLSGLETIEFSEAMKEMQSNWIGKSTGAEIDFELSVEGKQKPSNPLRVYTTRPDTIFGVDFMVIAPEHELVEQITTEGQQKVVSEYLDYVKSRSERERMAEKRISGAFTGAFAINPFNTKKIPVWISEYVLAGYGTGAIMAVPSGDERDFKFAKHFDLPVTNIIGEAFNGEEANPTKDATLSNSGFLDGMPMKKAIGVVADKLEAENRGKRKTNYKIRDAAFSRQRYWGEPFPIKWIDGIAYPLDENELPLELPFVDSYKPGPEGEGPLANIPEWTSQHLETNTMPGYAGSSWYFLRYMDPQNDESFCDRKLSDYWNQVDLYVGGTEHAVGHLLYSRMWTKALFDLGHISFDEPFRRLLNQGKIGGDSRLVYRVRGTNTFVSANIRDQYETDEIHADVNFVDGFVLDTGKFRKWRPDFEDAKFILEDGSEQAEGSTASFLCSSRLEKMGKRYFNVVNPDDVVARYGADTFRMYEMFLGPVEQDKPWDTKGIEGVFRFLKKFWRLFYDEEKGSQLTNYTASPAAKKILHRTIRKIEEDMEKFSYNTSVSALMVCVNELGDLKVRQKEILEPLTIILSPFAPHIAEELWHALGNEGSVLEAEFPVFDASMLVESSKEYPVSVNGKVRAQIQFNLDEAQDAVQETVLAHPNISKWTEGKEVKKFIYIKGKMINVVV